MSFWNNPENNTAKALLIIVLLGAVGCGIFKLAGSPDSNLQGSVFQGTKSNKAGQNMNKTTVNVYGKTAWDVSCDIDGDGESDWTSGGEQTGNWADKWLIT